MLNLFKRLLFTKPVTQYSSNDWVAVYHRLDVKYGLGQRGVHYYLFLRNPEHNEYWITFYFDNQALFKDRVELYFFISHDPEHIANVLRANKRAPFVSELTCSSQIERVSNNALTTIEPRGCKRFQDVSFRGGRYIEKIKHHHINPRLKAH